MPYLKIRTALDTLCLPNTTALAVDGTQGRERDYIIFATVRCNAENELGSCLKDECRVAWTRAQLSLVIARPLRGRTMVERCGARLLRIVKKLTLPHSAQVQKVINRRSRNVYGDAGRSRFPIDDYAESESTMLRCPGTRSAVALRVKRCKD